MQGKKKRRQGRELQAKAASLNEEELAVLVRAVKKTPDEDCSCDEAARHLDEYADRLLQGENVAALMPLIQRHLECCPDCGEEFTALQSMLSAQKGSLE